MPRMASFRYVDFVIRMRMRCHVAAFVERPIPREHRSLPRCNVWRCSRGSPRSSDLVSNGFTFVPDVDLFVKQLFHALIGRLAHASATILEPYNLRAYTLIHSIPSTPGRRAVPHSWPPFRALVACLSRFELSGDWQTLASGL